MATKSPRSAAPEPEVRISGELFAPVNKGIELCYQTFGNPEDDPLLLVMGLGGPMTWWDEDLCRLLARKGFYVVRYDNRDTGRSSRVGVRVGRAALLRAVAAGTRARPPYTLDDMAQDAFGLLDHLGLESAHVVGVSMGGMIGQTMAILQPRRVRSLTSIMSSTGKRTVGWQHPALTPTLLAPRGRGREAYLKSSATMWRLIGSPAFPLDHDAIATRAGETFDRGVSASGLLRQMMAIVSQPNRSPRLKSLKIPALVIHGLADKMVHVSGGRATAAAIPGAELLLIDGMGHDMPRPLYETIASGIRRTADRA